ncbi:helix-turn-helix domain-containing protein [Alterisphingorhabdus coralli]|uniref:Helix-turn-helix domain-containing protein n=1 Tax=Alterisphingorhabdus coralli TaxID=3071408 RepID=A0AA97I1A3_9SPHN|nr:helix-turn-helix domain-containing protein [Parasphingorhabdus sp. SCSIO 66989]WOE76534.1 helix-turn-helix domain-containing protein [Parasphingorhabdus sp. SCSIO 66989]
MGNTPITSLRPSGVIGDIAQALSGFAVVFLWWFCLSCFDRRFRPHGLVLAGGLTWAVLAACDRGLLGEAFADKGLSRLLVLLGFVIIGHLVWRLIAERQSDMIQQRHDARMMVAILLGGILFIDLTADAIFGFSWRPLAFAIIQNAMMLVFALWLANKLLVVNPRVLTFLGADRSGEGQAPLPVNDEQEDHLKRRLTVLMEEEQVFLDPELTFTAFVASMNASERTVRRLINHELGYDHFRAFLNHYRVAEARRLLRDQGETRKLVAVAHDSGFASLASFNRAFRAIEGCTPSEYRAAGHQGGRNSKDLAKAGF